MIDAALELASHGPESCGQNTGAFPGHRVVEYFSSTPFAAEEGAGRNVTIFKADLAHQHRAKPHFVFLFSNAQTGGSFFNDEPANTGRAELGIERCIDREQIRDRSIGDENFPPIKNVLAAILAGARLHRKNVRPRASKNGSEYV